jgi:hypothetical protein
LEVGFLAVLRLVFDPAAGCLATPLVVFAASGFPAVLLEGFVTAAGFLALLEGGAGSALPEAAFTAGLRLAAASAFPTAGAAFASPRDSLAASLPAPPLR